MSAAGPLACRVCFAAPAAAVDAADTAAAVSAAAPVPLTFTLPTDVVAYRTSPCLACRPNRPLLALLEGMCQLAELEVSGTRLSAHEMHLARLLARLPSLGTLSMTGPWQCGGRPETNVLREALRARFSALEIF